jgi:hypothetical protein
VGEAGGVPVEGEGAIPIVEEGETGWKRVEVVELEDREWGRYGSKGVEEESLGSEMARLVSDIIEGPSA